MIQVWHYDIVKIYFVHLGDNFMEIKEENKGSEYNFEIITMIIIHGCLG